MATEPAPRRSFRLWPGVAAIVAGCGLWMLVRTEGVTGNSESQLRWRWTRTPEEHLLAQKPFVATRAAGVKSLEPGSGNQKPQLANPEPEVHPATNTAGAASGAPTTARPTRAAPPAAGAAEAFWPGFRGPARDDVVRGVQVQTDWSTSVPVLKWRRPIGPGWSSFAVRGNLLYTQEQRGDHELVSCYAVSTGEPLWQHRDAVRFYESNGGAGPRAASYSSPHSVTIAGVPQVLQMTDGGVTSVSPADGTPLWKHAWDAGATIVQPAVISDGQVLISVTGATG